MLKTCVRMTVLVCLVALAASPAFAQAPTPAAGGNLVVTVTDQTGAVLPAATVTVTGQEPATRTSSVAPAAATSTGIARFEGLPLDAFIVRDVLTWRGVFKDTDRFDPRNYGAKYVPCPYLWSTMSISWDGTVVPCCLDTWAEQPLGRIGEKPLLEIWNGEPLRLLRRKLLAGEYSDIPLCSGCDLLWADKTIGKYPYTLLKVSLSHSVENLLGYHLTNLFKRLVKGDL